MTVIRVGVLVVVGDIFLPTCGAVCRHYVVGTVFGLYGGWKRLTQLAAKAGKLQLRQGYMFARSRLRIGTSMHAGQHTTSTSADSVPRLMQIRGVRDRLPFEHGQ